MREELSSASQAMRINTVKTLTFSGEIGKQAPLKECLYTKIDTQVSYIEVISSKLVYMTLYRFNIFIYIIYII